MNWPASRSSCGLSGRTARSATVCASRSCKTGWARSIAMSHCTRQWRSTQRVSSHRAATRQANDEAKPMLEDAPRRGTPPLGRDLELGEEKARLNEVDNTAGIVPAISTASGTILQGGPQRLRPAPVQLVVPSAVDPY